MKFLNTILFAILFLASCSFGHDRTVSDLYKELDSVMGNNVQTVARREARIEAMKKRLRSAQGCKVRFSLADSIFKEYSPYDNDSAVAWALRSASIARSMHNEVYQYACVLNLVEQYTKSGYFTEAAKHYTSLNSANMPRELLPKYYDVGSDLYGNSGYASEDPSMQENYMRRSIVLRDSFYIVEKRLTPVYMRNRVQQLVNGKHWQEALKVCDIWKKNVRQDTHDYAIMAYYRSEIYHHMGNTAKQKEWLIRSAIADIRNAVMDQASLWMLADILYNEGDIERAYKYMDFSWECVSQFSAHKRAWDVTPILTVINNSYQKKADDANQRLTILIILVTILLIASLGFLLYVQRKRNQLSEAQKALAESNKRLQLTIDKLNQTNAALHESDRVKDKYIGNFFSMCSAYIDKLDAFRAKVRRKLKAGQKDDIMKMTDPDIMRTEEHKSLMNTFDDTFLSLYPAFVDEFNSLLKPDCSIRPTGKERMNATLRIFALIRLGITESSRIAEILGYSPNSVYNYRTRAKNMSAVPRDEFEERLKVVAIS